LDRWLPGSDAEAILSVDTAKLPPPHSYDLWFAAGYVRNLLLVTDDNGGATGVLVGSRLFSHLGGSYTALPWLQVGANLPLVLYQARGDAPSAALGPVGALAAAGLGDLSLRAKLALASAQKLGVDLAFVGALSLPTHAPRNAYLGDDGVSFSGAVTASRQLFNFELSADLGYFWRRSAQFLNATLGPEVRAGFGVRRDLEPLTSLPVAAEVTWTLAARPASPFKNINETPSELLFGATYHKWLPLVIGAAAGLGVAAGIGTPDVRVLLTARWVARPANNGAVSETVGPCPAAPADFDGFLDDDGCPATAVSIQSDRLVLGDNVNFEVNKSVLVPKSQALLKRLGDALRANPQIKKVRIEGHTDSDGDAQDNLHLSQARANAVRDFLITMGVSADRLIAEGFGASRPVATNATGGGRSKNRRVEFMIVDATKADKARETAK